MLQKVKIIINNYLFTVGMWWWSAGSTCSDEVMQYDKTKVYLCNYDLQPFGLPII